jgi:hypothetical protein
LKKQLIFWVVIAGLIVGGLALLETRRIDTAKLDQAALYKIATTSPEGRFAKYPKLHPVSCPACPESGLQILASAVTKGRVAAAQGAGNYDSNTGKIKMVADEIRWEASLPKGFRPNFEHALRHEYGHALLDDWLKGAAQASAGGRQLAYLPYTEGTNDTGSYPKVLRPVLTEYHTVKPDIYGAVYYSSTFGEYMAESYARFCEGKSVPQGIAGFLRSQLSPK